MTDSVQLDAQELLHLGLYALEQDQPQQAIECLKRCLQIEPDSGKATYLLGALYAQIGLYDRAKTTLARAVVLSPDEHTASFQLGLLHLTSNELPEAHAAWARLDALPSEHFLNCFRQGLLALIADNFVTSTAMLEKGIAANKLNEALNNDMRNLLASVQSVAEAPAAHEASASTTPGGHHFLGSYRQIHKQ
jgi:tetratricopeptide (TPR) repeat protein